ncbi:MAG: tetratricopeptide repeat protein [Pirellulales bacterium]
MPVLIRRTPSYRLHKARGCAVAGAAGARGNLSQAVRSGAGGLRGAGGPAVGNGALRNARVQWNRGLVSANRPFGLTARARAWNRLGVGANRWGWNRWWRPIWRRRTGSWPFAWYWPFFGNYGYGRGYANNYPYANPTATEEAPATPPDAEAILDATKYADQGEAAFRAGQYANAVKAFRHALIESPRNGVLQLLLAQGLFATGEFEEAAATLQQGMFALPDDQWPLLAKNLSELYPQMSQFQEQLVRLEHAPASPTQHFLLAYYYGYLGRTPDALEPLDAFDKLAAGDPVAARLRELWAPAAKKLWPPLLGFAISRPAKRDHRLAGRWLDRGRRCCRLPRFL